MSRKEKLPAGVSLVLLHIDVTLYRMGHWCYTVSILQYGHIVAMLYLFLTCRIAELTRSMACSIWRTWPGEKSWNEMWVIGRNCTKPEACRSKHSLLLVDRVSFKNFEILSSWEGRCWLKMSSKKTVRVGFRQADHLSIVEVQRLMASAMKSFHFSAKRKR